MGTKYLTTGINNMLKKFFVSLGLAVGLVLSAQGAATSTTVSNTIMTNFSLLSTPARPIKILNVTITTPAATAGRFTFYDTPTNVTVFTNLGYTNIGTYVTNYIAVWTNYYGATNYWTNRSLVQFSNTVASNNYSYNAEIDVYVPTNSSITLNGVNALFTFGCWVTNNGTGTGVPTVSVTYQQ